MGNLKNTGPGTDQEKISLLHTPVMLEEVLALLQVKPNRDYVDGTLGLGGHSEAILNASAPTGRLVGIDRDQMALKLASERLQTFGTRAILKHGLYTEVAKLFTEAGIDQVDGMLLDLGVSSLQLDDAQRGFSFLKDSALDMRMDLEERMTARDILEESSEEELEEIFRSYGEERFSKRIARAIVQTRQSNPITDSSELRKLVSRAVPFSKGRIHPATRVFQALRIAVNRELELLQNFIQGPFDFLKVGGILAIITFHSLEDRIVKHGFRSLKNFKVLTKKPLIPKREEILKNPRSRSAKLRAVVREY